MDDWFLVSGYVAIGINNQSGHACRHYPRRCSHKSICSRFHMVPRRRHTPQLVAAHLVLQAPDIVPCIWTQFHPSNSLTMDQSTRLAAATLRLVSSARIFTTEHRADLMSIDYLSDICSCRHPRSRRCRWREPEAHRERAPGLPLEVLGKVHYHRVFASWYDIEGFGSLWNPCFEYLSSR